MIIAVNLGGAVVPTVVSLSLMVKYEIYFRAIIGIMIVAAVVRAPAAWVKKAAQRKTQNQRLAAEEFFL